MAFLRKELDEEDYIFMLLLILQLQNLTKC